MQTANTLSLIGISVRQVQLVEDLLLLPPITLDVTVPCRMAAVDAVCMMVCLMVCVINTQATDTYRTFLWHTYMSGLS